MIKRHPSWGVSSLSWQARPNPIDTFLEQLENSVKTDVGVLAITGVWYDVTHKSVQISTKNFSSRIL